MEDKDFMQQKVHEKGSEISMVVEKLRHESKRNNELQQQVKSQEIEIRTLLNCVENLRKQVISHEKVDAT